MKITLENGKYEFYEVEPGVIHCKRYGEPWRIFTGDRATYLLVSRCKELEDERDALHADLIGQEHRLGTRADVLEHRLEQALGRISEIRQTVQNVDSVDRDWLLKVLDSELFKK